MNELVTTAYDIKALYCPHGLLIKLAPLTSINIIIEQGIYGRYSHGPVLPMVAGLDLGNWRHSNQECGDFGGAELTVMTTDLALSQCRNIIQLWAQLAIPSFGASDPSYLKDLVANLAEQVYISRSINHS